MMLHVSHTRVNDCLNYLFSKLNHTIDQCSPTKDALEKHILRATLQSYIWSKSTRLKEEYITVTDRRWMLTSGGCQSTMDKITESFKDMQRVEKLQVQKFVLTWHVTCKTYAISSPELCPCDRVCQNRYHFFDDEVRGERDTVKLVSRLIVHI